LCICEYMCVHICMCIHNFGAGTALRSVRANHVVLVRLTLDQFIFWPKLPQIAGFGIKNLKKKFSGVTPPDPLSRSGRSPPASPPARLHVVRGGASSPVLGPRSQKPFPQIKIYHYTPVINIYTDRHTPTPTNRPRYSVAVGRIPCCACDAVWLHQVDKTQKSSLL